MRNRMIDKALLFLCCAGVACMYGAGELTIVAMLFGIILACLFLYVDLSDLRLRRILMIINLILTIVFPPMVLFSSLLMYEIVRGREKLAGIIFAAAFAVHVRGYSWHETVYLILMLFISCWLEQQSEKNSRLSEELIRLRDNSVELTIVLKRRNKTLLQKQEYDIHLATLSERNRIAREIHDNVGHMLSRSILQVGALLAVNTNEAQNAGLKGLKQTLDLAMNSIRKSVHNLHDESVDLCAAVNEAAEGMKGFKTEVNYDVESAMNKEIKYCILAAVKEALSNIARHSDADKIQISIREHPGFFQCTIEDNGSCRKLDNNCLTEACHGMGLVNMKERTEALGGTFLVTAVHGVRIFIMIPKCKDEKK